MPYYSAGDYYRGDYYRGDNYAAGGLFGTLGKIIGGVGKAVVKGGLGLLTGGPAGAIRGVVSSAAESLRPAPVRMISGASSSSAAAYLPGFGGEPGLGRRRRMNPLNIRALRRAMRRAKGFEKQARRVGSFFHPGKTYRLKGRGRRK
jgi:hypothetical protein